MSERDYGVLVEAVGWIEQHAGKDAPEYPEFLRLPAVVDNIAKRRQPDSSKQPPPVSSAGGGIVDLRNAPRAARFEVTFGGQILDGNGQTIDPGSLVEPLGLVRAQLFALGAVDTAGDGTVEITVAVGADSIEDALRAGGVLIGAATRYHPSQWSIEWLSGRATRQGFIHAR